MNEDRMLVLLSSVEEFMGVLKQSVPRQVVDGVEARCDFFAFVRTHGTRTTLP
jgi:hypothetical protein